MSHLLDGASLIDRVAGDPVWMLADRRRLLVCCRLPKEGWAPRQEERREGFPSAGSCVELGGAPYEIREALRDEQTGDHVYVLAPWESSFPIRRIHHHDAAHHAAEIEERRRALRERRLLYPALYLAFPLLGLLPADRQLRLQDRFGLSAARMTSISGILAAGACGAILAWAVGNLALGPLVLVAFFFLTESLMRWSNAWRLEEPMGSLPVWLIVRTLDAFAHERDQRRRRRAGHPDALPGRRRRELAALLDAVAPAADGGLRVTSFTPKGWGVGATIGYHGSFFVLERTTEHETPEGMEFRHDLRQARVEEVFRTVTPYRPDEALRALRAAEDEARHDRLNMLAPLLGLLPARLQESWEGFQPLRAVRQSCFLVALGAGLQLFYRTGHPTAEPGLDLVEGGLAAYLLVESGWRTWRVLYGEVTGSVLGLPLALLVRRRRAARAQTAPQDPGVDSSLL